MMTKTDHASTTSHNHLNKGHTKPETFESDADEEGIEAPSSMMTIVDNNEDSVEEDTIEDGYTYTKSWTSTWPSGMKILKFVIVGGLLVVAGIAGASLKRNGAATTTAYAKNTSKTGKNTKAPKSQGCTPPGGACSIDNECCDNSCVSVTDDTRICDDIR